MDMIGESRDHPLRVVVSWLLWPLLFGYGVAGLTLAMQTEAPFVWFNVTYLSLAGLLILVERLMPHERAWLEHDGQTVTDLAHTLVNKGAIQGLLAVGAVVGVTGMADVPPSPLWPVHWPLWIQIPLGLVVVEFGLYWAHRLAHEWPLLWRFHAIHHSAPRLWVVNTGRFHFVDTIVSTLAAVAVILALGIPESLVIWGAGLHAFIGLLTHCNAEMRFGPLSYVFNTPELHRWHHSRRLEEGNRNYGENLMIWDIVFGTYFNPDRRPPRNVGIDAPMPTDFLGQLVAPFRQARRSPAGTADRADASTSHG